MAIIYGVSIDYNPLCESTGYLTGLGPGTGISQYSSVIQNMISCKVCLTPVAAVNPTIGRVAFLKITQTGSNQSLGFTGGACVSGTEIMFISSSNGSSTDGVPSGGAAWTAYQADQSPSSRTYYHVCGGSEPATYTIAYSGSGKGDAMQVIMVEILNANASNPYAEAHYREQDHGGTLTTANQSVTSTNSLSLAILAPAYVLNLDVGATQVLLPPTGYTLHKYYPQDITNGLWGIAIASKATVGSGTISPGPFTDAGSGTANLMNLATTTLWKP